MDEAVHFEPEEQVVNVKELCPEGTIIHVVQAFDPDGGQTSFAFKRE